MTHSVRLQDSMQQYVTSMKPSPHPPPAVVMSTMLYRPLTTATNAVIGKPMGFSYKTADSRFPLGGTRFPAAIPRNHARAERRVACRVPLPAPFAYLCRLYVEATKFVRISIKE